MRSLELNETKNISGGAWCTYHGYPGNGAGNQIWIEGDDCSVLRESIQINRGGFDVSGLIMGVGFIWSGAIIGYAATTVFGFGAIASGGIGIAFGLALATGYAATHR